MGFFKNLYKSALAATVGVLALTGCQPEESPLARAIMTSVSGLEFAAQNAEPQTIQVYADADWTVEAPEWVTVDKMEGSRSMEVTISVGDNMRGGAIDNPKKDTIVFKGYNLLAQAYVIVSQQGDKYRDVPPTALADVPAMKDEAVVILDNVTVAAVSTNGFIVTDGSANLFVLSKNNVAVGDKVNVKGSKGTINDLPAITICDGVEVTGNAAVTYPSTTDVTASIDTYSSKSITYVEMSGVLNGNEIVVKGATRSGIVLDAPASFDLAALNGHKVTVKGYFAGSTVSVVNIIATEIVDLGVDEIIYFADNFDWVQPFVEADIAKGRTQGDSMLDDAQYTVSSSYDLEGFADALANMGYEALFPSSKAIYVMKGNYLKFSKTSNTNGIRLPSMTYEGATSVVLSFDWGINVGSGGPDKVELEVEVEGNGSIEGSNKSAPLIHTAGNWEWQTETLTIVGVDENTRITIKPTGFTGVKDADKTYYRWFLDNVKVVQGEGGAVTPPAPKPETPLHAEWLFTADAMADAATGYQSTFADQVKEAGDGGQYVAANVAGNGKITYVQIDKTSIDADGKAQRTVGSTGHPFVYGAWPGDYWLFEATDGYAYPAGTSVNISFITRTSKTGHKYWRLEYIDGEEWKPAIPTKKETINGVEAEHNIVMADDGKTNIAVNEIVTLTAPTKDIKFRMICVANAQSSDGAALEKPNGGTCRIAGDDTGTSPVIKVME